MHRSMRRCHVDIFLFYGCYDGSIGDTSFGSTELPYARTVNMGGANARNEQNVGGGGGGGADGGLCCVSIQPSLLGYTQQQIIHVGTDANYIQVPNNIVLCIKI